MARKTKGPALPVPKTAGECNHLIETLGYTQRALQRIETEMNEEIAAVKARHEETAAGLKDDEKQLFRAIQAYCESFRDVLTEDGKTKSYEFAAGKIGWRMSPGKVALKNVKEIIARLLGRKSLHRFLRFPDPQIDKEAMLKEPEAAAKVEGVTIEKGEEFFVEPFGTEISEPREGA